MSKNFEEENNNLEDNSKNINSSNLTRKKKRKRSIFTSDYQYQCNYKYDSVSSGESDYFLIEIEENEKDDSFSYVKDIQEFSEESEESVDFFQAYELEEEEQVINQNDLTKKFEELEETYDLFEHSSPPSPTLFDEEEDLFPPFDDEDLFDEKTFDKNSFQNEVFTPLNGKFEVNPFENNGVFVGGNTNGAFSGGPFSPMDEEEREPALEKYGTDLTALAASGKVNECFGREDELLQVMEILVRRQKNNPVLVGDAGVGKTAIVELFATKLVQNLVPFVLQGRKIISLDLARIVAGSRYRGEFELRFRRIVEEVLAQSEIIVFIDEIHNISGAGSAEGSLDAANILKPVLSRSGFQCIGATTIKEYERIEKDAALNRRFQAVKVLEPTVEQTRHILYSLRSTFESYHNLEITAAAIGTAVDLTHRYIYDRYLPDKAIDILDRACAKEVVRITAPKYGSILSSIVNGALVNIGIMKVEAFRRGDIAAEFLLNEVEKAYRNFLLRWINDPTLLPELSLDEEAEEEEKELEEYFRVLPSVDAFATKEREKRIEEIKEKRKRRLEETLAPLSASLYEEMRLLVLGRVDELLFTSQRSMAEIPSFSKKKIGKICDLTRDKNREVISSVLNGLYTERKLDISLYRILLFLTLQWQKPIVKNDLTELFGNELKEEEVSFENFYNYITNIRHQISTRSFAIYEKHMDFIESDIEQREEMYPYLSELDLNRFEVFQDHLIKLKPLMDRTFASSFMRSSRLNDPMRIGVDQRKDIFDLLGFLSTPLGHEVTTKADDPRLIKLAQKFGNFGPLKYQITAPKIRNLISSMTGIPVTSISSQESEKLLNLESTLHRRIIGQDLAVTAIAKAIRRARLGVQDPNRPLACFLFCGPTGVGKTEVTKALADTLFGSEKNMLRLDMSEFMEKFTVSRLIGSPPGYIGYEEGGQLTDYVRTKPYSVILFDEVEKAHPDVLNILLQIMEDGRLTDTQKRLVKFENTLIIMTSNAGSEDILDVLQNENFSELGVYQDTFSKEKETKQSIDKSKNIKVSEDKYGVTYDLLESPIKESFLSDIREGLQKEFFQSFFRKKDYSQLQKLVKEKNKDNLNEDIESLKEKENENFFNQVKEESKKKETELIEQLKSVVLERLNMYFLPEFLNRLDDIIIFLPLRIEELRKICEIMVENLIKRLQKSKLFVVVDENVKFKLSVESYNPAFGARPLRRVIRRSLEDLFCEDMLREPIPPNGRSIFVTLDDDEKIIIEKD